MEEARAVWLCVGCGTQKPVGPIPGDGCPVCRDERQFVPPEGQRWTTLAALRARYRNRWMEAEPGLHRVGMVPNFAIGQHAWMVSPGAGEGGRGAPGVLWDLVSLVDDETLEGLHGRGGVSAIAISHPHYHSTMAEWSRALDDLPVYVHSADRAWVPRRFPGLRLWEGERLALGRGLTLIHGGGHFDGSAMLHWAAGAGGRGVLLAGDTVQVTRDPRWVSFMYSYANYLPLPVAAVDRLVERLAPFRFERIYSPWPDRVVATEAERVVRRSRDRYRRAVAGELPTSRASGQAPPAPPRSPRPGPSAPSP